MPAKKFLLLQNNYMSYYTLEDVAHLDNVVIFHHKSVSKSRILNLLYNLHNSGRIQKHLELPFKGLWDELLFGQLMERFVPDYVVFTTSWYSDHLLSFFRNKCNSKLILRFSDMVVKSIGTEREATIEKIREQFDGVLVYSEEDAAKYGFTYHSVGYSAICPKLLKPRQSYDIVFIGAEKGRIDKIREAYNLFVSAGLSCFFYVLMVKEKDRRDDGIVYADSIMPFDEYLSYEYSAKCLFEIVQDGSSGRTYRMMESIIYNKLLITNCQEISHTRYYNRNYVHLYNNISEIDPSFVKNCPNEINYHYAGDFSPLRVLDFIENTW